MSHGPNRAAEPTPRYRSQTHFIPQKLQIKKNHEGQQFVDDASGFAAISGKNNWRTQISNLRCLTNANVYLRRSVNTCARLTLYKDMYKHM